MKTKKNKQTLIRSIESYIPDTETEQKHRKSVLMFLRENNNNFERSNLKGHITGSAWLLNKEKTKVLLNYHRKFNKWMQFGGHADGDTDILAVAIKEAQEESGLTNIYPVFSTIFDVDVHAIPANLTKTEPAHYHYDVRYLLWTPEREYTISKESIDLKWVNINEIRSFVKAESLTRMIDKWEHIINS